MTEKEYLEVLIADPATKLYGKLPTILEPGSRGIASGARQKKGTQRKTKAS